MTDDPHDTMRRKVSELFSAIPQDRIERLSPARGAVEAMDAIASEEGRDFSGQVNFALREYLKGREA